MIKGICLVIAVVLVLVVPPYAHTFFAARSALHEARDLRQAGDLERASDLYRQAAGWRSPFNGYAKSAATELFDLAQDEALTDDLKRTMLMRLKSALKGSRSLFAPEVGDGRSALLVQVEEQLADLERGTFAKNSTVGVAEVRPYQVSYVFQIFAQAMFWFWIAAVICTVYYAFSPDGKIAWGRLAVGVGTIALTFTFWLLYLSYA